MFQNICSLTLLTVRQVYWYGAYPRRRQSCRRIGMERDNLAKIRVLAALGGKTELSSF